MKFKIIFILLISIFLSGCGMKREGVVNFSATDCFEQIKVKQNDITNIFRDYTCEYYKNKSDKIYDGVCYSFEIKNGKCNRVYSYNIPPEFSCTENSKMSYDGECYCVDGYKLTSNKEKCIKNEDIIKKNEESELYEIKYSYPVISEVSNYVNNTIKDYLIKIVDDFKNNTTSIDSGFGKNLLNISYENYIIKDNFISVIFDYSIYNSGAAHGLNSKESFNFDLKSNQKISLVDLLAGNDYLQFLSDFSYNYLINDGIDYDWTKDGVSPKYENFSNFSFGENDLNIYFAPYAVAPFSAGIQKVSIPYKDLTKYIDQKYVNIFTSKK